MTYIDGFVIAAPTANRERLQAMTTRVDRLFVEHGALRVVEAWGEEVPDGEQTDFKRAVALKEGETVMFSWIEWPSKEVRDQAYAALENDARLTPLPEEEGLFDSRRMIYGGFVPITDERA